MADLTKLLCDLLSCGASVMQAEPHQIARHIDSLVANSGVSGLIDATALEEHIGALQVAHRRCEQELVQTVRGADFDIDDIRTCLAQGRVVGVGEVLNHFSLGSRDVVKFQGKCTLKLPDGSEATFDSFVVTHA